MAKATLKEQLKAIRNKLAEVQLDGLTLYVRKLSAREVSDYTAAYHAKSDDELTLMGKLVAQAVVDAEGKPVFNDAAEVIDFDFSTVKALAEAASRHSGMHADQKKD